MIDREQDGVSINRFPGDIEQAATHLGRRQKRNLGSTLDGLKAP